MRKKSIAWLLSLAVALSLAGIRGEASPVCTVCSALEEEGFPKDYREALCALKIKHPAWSFVPLFVTELSRQEGREYSFSAVLAEEVGVWDRSLIPGEEALAPYRNESHLRTDTGAYLASDESVAYFLDPRNHLSDRGLFQFLLLSDSGLSGEEAVLRAWSGTVLEECVSPSALVQLGREAKIEPLQLAVRLRQEQGSEGNVLLTGKAGSVLSAWYKQGTQQEEGRMVLAPTQGQEIEELCALDGFFNPFNVSAGGSGAFAVYYSGACHAREKGWNTLEKGLRGGVNKLATEYVERYQNTLYLQKWNVDIRSREENGASRNFWAQYMQNIAAPTTEADRLYELYEEIGLLEEPLSFLIPVYEGLPEVPCPDPAGGTVERTATCPIQASPHLYRSDEALISVSEKTSSTEPSFGQKEELSPLVQVLLPIVFCLPALGICALFFTLSLPIICEIVSKKTKK